MNILELRGINHFRLAVLKKYAYFRCILDKKMEEVVSVKDRQLLKNVYSTE